MDARTSYNVIGTTSAEVYMLPNVARSSSDILPSGEDEGVSCILMPISRIENSIESLERERREQSSMNLRYENVTEGYELEYVLLSSNAPKEASTRYPVESCTPDINKKNSLKGDVKSTKPEISKLMHTSSHISHELRLAEIDRYCAENVDLSKLSASNTKGIFKDERGKYYLEVSEKYVSAEKITDNVFYISHPDRRFLIIMNSDGLFTFSKNHMKNVPLRLFNFRDSSTLGFHGSYLDVVNKTRSDIFSHTLEKTSLIIDDIAKTVMKMSVSDIIKDIKENFGVTVVKNDATKLKKHILNFPKKIDEFLKDKDKFFFISTYDELDFVVGGYNNINELIVITDGFFSTCTVFPIIILLHELSHATGALDIFYLHKCTKNEHQRKSFFRLPSLTSSEKNKFKKHVAEFRKQLINKIFYPDKVSFQPGHEYRPDITDEIQRKDVLNRDDFHKLIANNADTIMLYSLHLFDKYSKNKQVLSTTKRTIKHLLNSEENQKTFISTILNMPVKNISS